MQVGRAAGNASDENIKRIEASFSQLDVSVNNVLGGDAGGAGGAPSVHEGRTQGVARATVSGRVLSTPGRPDGYIQQDSGLARYSGATHQKTRVERGGGGGVQCSSCHHYELYEYVLFFFVVTTEDGGDR